MSERTKKGSGGRGKPGPGQQGGSDRSAGKEASSRGRTDRILDLVEAGLWVALLIFGSVVALAALRDDRGPPKRFKAPVGLIEAENMRVLGKSRDFTFWLQPTADFRTGRWSQDGHMFAFGTQKGDWIDLEFPEFEPGKYRMSLFMTKAADYGIVNVSLNGTPIGEPIDLWSGYGVMPTNKLDLGIVELRGEDDVLRLAVNATNPKAAAPFFQFGIDGVRLSSLPEE